MTELPITARYPWIQHLHTVPIDWNSEGDEWLHWFSECVAEGAGSWSVSGHKFDQTTKPFVEVQLRQSVARGVLNVLVAPTVTGALVFVASTSTPSATDLASLQAAAESAETRMGTLGSAHEWTAVIGHPSERIGGTEKRLAVEASVGPLTVTSCGVLFNEPDASWNPTLTGWSLHRSVPISVAGSSHGYSWEAAARKAARDLRLLCGILSVAWDTELAIREAAAPVEWGLRSVPDRPPWYALPDDVRPSSEDTATGEPVTVPDWACAAWDRAIHDGSLVRALDAYLEGIYLMPRHPSLAAVALTACIEVVSAKVFKLPRCGTCGAETGIASSFRAALRLVLPEDEAALLDGAYGSRSRTVHSGHLHGGETSPGLWFPGIWSSDSAQDFRWQTLWRLKKAARQLAQQALLGDLPPKIKTVTAG